ncbi:MAG TPA: HNH endonuclease signature motif containing protein [Aggregatilineaceae bacterium]|nr:HNH endonuclease signature motif containing protein [Aggregatilineaceae bacterium]
MSISDELRERVRKQAGNRCGYCQSSQQYVFGPLEIDHLTPTAHGGTDDEENLWLACRMCNGFKSDHTHGRDPVTGEEIRLFNPRTQRWAEHFAWSEDGTQIVGLTPCGRATVVVLQLNNVIAVMVRREWVAAGWHPPK